MKKIILFIMLVFIPVILYADTVIMKDNTRQKGLVVEEYVDRIVLSTIDGEKDILRADIEKIEYDTPEQNFMQLGRLYDAKGWFDKAAFYYKKAMEINPDYKEAREAYLASHAKMWQEEERRVKRELDRRVLANEWRNNRNKKENSGMAVDKAGLLKDVLGVSLLDQDGVFIIDEVVPDSSAGKAGIKKGDFLVGIWGKLIRYSKKEDVLNELFGPKYSEVRVTVEKKIFVETDAASKNAYKDLGVLLGFEYEGLLVKEVAIGRKGDKSGFKKGDFIIAIDNNITRYLPMDSVIALINSAKNKEIVFVVRRNINLRRER